MLRTRMQALRSQAAPPLPVIPLDKVKPDHGEGSEYPATVIVELDALHLPDHVYAEHDLASLERLLEERLVETGAGDLDGHLRGLETTEVYLVGEDARVIYDVIVPVLRNHPLCTGALVKLQQGGEVTTVSLGSKHAN